MLFHLSDKVTRSPAYKQTTSEQQTEKLSDFPSPPPQTAPVNLFFSADTILGGSHSFPDYFPKDM